MCYGAFRKPRAGALGSLTECPLDIRPCGVCELIPALIPDSRIPDYYLPDSRFSDSRLLHSQFLILRFNIITFPIPPIPHWLQHQNVQHIDIVRPGVGDVNELGNIASQIQKRGWRQLPWPVDDNYLGRLSTGTGPVREAGLW